jgi:hypothetical protein
MKVKRCDGSAAIASEVGVPSPLTSHSVVTGIAVNMIIARERQRGECELCRYSHGSPRSIYRASANSSRRQRF